MGGIVNFIHQGQHPTAQVGWVVLGFVGVLVHGDLLVGYEKEFNQCRAGAEPEFKLGSFLLVGVTLRQFDRPPKTLGQELESRRDFEFGTCTVEQIILFQSVLKPEGATYCQLTTVQLGNE